MPDTTIEFETEELELLEKAAAKFQSFFEDLNEDERVVIMGLLDVSIERARLVAQAASGWSAEEKGGAGKKAARVVAKVAQTVAVAGAGGLWGLAASTAIVAAGVAGGVAGHYAGGGSSNDIPWTEIIKESVF